MLAVSFARRDRAAASAVLSDALGIAVVLGCALAAALYVAAPAALAAIAGEASREVIAPALSYVRIRCCPCILPKELGGCASIDCIGARKCAQGARAICLRHRAAVVRP